MGKELLGLGTITKIAGVVVIGAGVAYVGSLMGFWGVASASGQGAGESSLNEGITQTVCDDTASVALFATYDDFSYSPAVETGIATGAYLYRDDSVVAMNTTTTSATADTTIANVVPCGQDFRVIYGEDNGGTDYYYGELSKTADGEIVPSALKLKTEGTVSMTVQNTTTFGASSVSADFSAGTANSDVSFKIMEKSASTYWGDGRYLISVGGSSSNYSNFQVDSLDGIAVNSATCPTSVVNHYGANMVVKCFEVEPSDTKGVFTHEFQLTAQPLAGITPTLNISIGTADYAGRIKNGAILNEYDNSDTNADIGATNVYLDNAVVPY